MRENAAIVRVYPRHVSERERPMTMMLLPDLPKGVRPLVMPSVYLCIPKTLSEFLCDRIG